MLATKPNASKRVVGDCDCGASITEAKNKGCTWDSLAGAWLPDRCRDYELTAWFKKASPKGGWTYYADANQTLSLNETEVSLRADGPDTSYWVTLDWHVEHCLFYWKKSLRRKLTGKLLESRFANVDHIDHCREMILRRGKEDGGKVVELHAELTSKWLPGER